MSLIIAYCVIFVWFWNGYDVKQFPRALITSVYICEIVEPKRSKVLQVSAVDFGT